MGSTLRATPYTKLKADGKIRSSLAACLMPGRRPKRLGFSLPPIWLKAQSQNFADDRTASWAKPPDTGGSGMVTPTAADGWAAGLVNDNLIRAFRIGRQGIEIFKRERSSGETGWRHPWPRPIGEKSHGSVITGVQRRRLGQCVEHDKHRIWGGR